MRRLRILLAGALVAGTAGAWSGVAYGDRPALGDFCDLAEEESDDVLGGADFEDIDFTNPNAFREVYENAADVMKDLRKQAPKKLKPAFNTARKYFVKLSKIDFTDPRDATEAFIPGRKVARAFQKITSYLVDECGLDLSDFEGIGGD